MEDKIRIGVSTCLLGQQVRFDGGHKHDRYLTNTLGEYLDFVPVCPEVEAGFPVPRETFRLVGDPENPRLVTSRSHIEHTDRMLGWAKKRVRELEKENLCGFIFKSDSPSSGLMRVKVYNPKGMAGDTGSGPEHEPRRFSLPAQAAHAFPWLGQRRSHGQTISMCA